MLLAGAYLSGCRELTILSYPHDFLGEIQTSAEWQEISFPARTVKHNEHLILRLPEGGPTVCDDPSENGQTHLCSAEAAAEIERLRADDRKNGTVETFERRKKIIREQPLLNVEIELANAAGAARRFVNDPLRSGRNHSAAFENELCAYGSIDEDQVRRGANANQAFYPEDVMKEKRRACEAAGAESFVKMRIRSPQNLKIERIQIGTYQDIMH
jgi:hypothetical protein